MFLLSYSMLSNSENENIYPSKETSRKLIDRSIIGAVSLALMYYNIVTLPIYSFNTITRTSIIFTYFISIGIGRDKFMIRKIVCILICILGAVLVIRENQNRRVTHSSVNITGIAVFFGFLNAFLKAIIPIMIQNVGNVNPLHNSLYTSGFMILTSVILLVFTSKTVVIVSMQQLFLQIVSGLIGFGLQTTKVLALRYEKATTVVIIDSIVLVYSFLFQSLVMKETPSISGWLGGSLVMRSTVVYTLLETPKVSEKTEKH